MLLGMVTTANEWSAFHVSESFGHAHFLEACEAVGVDEFGNRKVRFGGL